MSIKGIKQTAKSRAFLFLFVAYSFLIAGIIFGAMLNYYLIGFILMGFGVAAWVYKDRDYLIDKKEVDKLWKTRLITHHLSRTSKTTFLLL